MLRVVQHSVWHRLDHFILAVIKKCKRVYPDVVEALIEFFFAEGLHVAIGSVSKAYYFKYRAPTDWSGKANTALGLSLFSRGERRYQVRKFLPERQSLLQRDFYVGPLFCGRGALDHHVRSIYKQAMHVDQFSETGHRRVRY